MIERSCADDSRRTQHLAQSTGFLNLRRINLSEAVNIALEERIAYGKLYFPCRCGRVGVVFGIDMDVFVKTFQRKHLLRWLSSTDRSRSLDTRVSVAALQRNFLISCVYRFVPYKSNQNDARQIFEYHP